MAKASAARVLVFLLKAIVVAIPAAWIASSLATSAQPARRQAADPATSALHPAVTAMPAESETSLVGVARWIAQSEPDARRRAKAVHDYVADRVVYDVEAFATRNVPPQDAETVFRRRKAVCAGYAHLVAAIGEAAGLHVAVVAGDARTIRGLDGERHAWNAVELDGDWALLDAAWDAGSIEGARFEKGYRTDYLFTPPAIFVADHLPEDPAWQLLDAPLARADFLRQPMLAPRFHADEIESL